MWRRIDDKIYHVTFYIWRGPKSKFRAACKKLLGSDCGDVADGKFYAVDNRAAIYACDKSVLVHELTHAAIYTLVGRGLKITLETDEAVAYYMGWLYQEATK